MKFHAPSFLLGAAVTSAVWASRGRLRPVVVEISALGVHLGRIGRSIAGRQREDLEDLWAEVEDRLRARADEAAERRAAAHTGNGAAARA
jgi:hypothetical protein